MGETPELSVFLDRLGDPVDLGIPPDGLVERVDEDDLEVLVGRVLADPVGAEDAESLQTTTDTLLARRTKVIKVSADGRRQATFEDLSIRSVG